MKLLLIKDECKLIGTLFCLLKKNGYVVDAAMYEEKGVEMAVGGVYDIIILDCVLSRRNGIAFLKELRNLKVDTHVLFLTVKDTPKYRVEALDAGADDYLAKPFYTEELLARIRALTRRKGKKLVGNVISVDGLTLNPLEGKAVKGDNTIRLTVKETLILEMLMRNFGQVVTKERILERVWGYNSEINIANIDLYIHYLRKKLDVSNIRTVRGVGYFLK